MPIRKSSCKYQVGIIFIKEKCLRLKVIDLKTLRNLYSEQENSRKKDHGISEMQRVSLILDFLIQSFLYLDTRGCPLLLN